uniref:Uncharacterized protein n=1 Tax=Romanomermis culicivorax TaxID=13658 RepID=A0A915J2Z3_ROMCU
MPPLFVQTRGPYHKYWHQAAPPKSTMIKSSPEPTLWIPLSILNHHRPQPSPALQQTTTAAAEQSQTPAKPPRRLPSAANPFDFLDYPPYDYYDHPQPRYKMPLTSHRKEDSRIKTIVNNMHPLIIDPAAENKRLLCFFIRLENEFGYDASNH